MIQTKLFLRCVKYMVVQSHISHYKKHFFSRRQHEGETLLEFSLALLSLFERVKSQSPQVISNGDIVVRDQFVECVSDNALRRELKQLIRRQPTVTLLEVRGEAIRWEREGMPGGARGRTQSVPLIGGFQFEVRGGPGPVRGGPGSVPGGSSPVRGGQLSELGELREMLRQQQQQINLLTQTMTRNQNAFSRGRASHSNQLICRRCQQPGHFARECDGERCPPRPPSRPLVAPLSSQPRSLSGPNPSEN